MPYTLTHDIEQDYLDVAIDVKMDPERAMPEALKRWQDVFKLATKYSVKRVHVLMSFSGTLDLSSRFRLTTSAQNLGMSKKCKLAVSIPDEKAYQEFLFAQTALNTLGYQIKFFKCKPKAISWLQSS